MAGIIAPGVCRYAVHGTYSGRPVVNILDLSIDVTTGDREDAVAEYANVIVQQWIDDIVENLVTAYTATEVSWVDLDSEFGSVGATTLGVTSNFPQAGTGAGDPMPGNVAVRIDKRIVAARGQRQGRMYLCGLGESQTASGAPNVPSAAYIAAINADLASFLAGINGTVLVSPPVDATAELVVVHTQNTADPGDPPVIVFTGASPITSLVCDATLGSQRRRLRG